MKKTIIFSAALVLLLATAACKQETHTTVDETGTSSTSTISTEVPAVDTAAVNDAAADTTAAVNDAAATATAAAKEGARDAAHATGTAMETAGQEIQRETTKTHT
jgi:hypothetical protein